MQDHKKVEKLLLNLSIIANKYFDIYQKLINKPSKHINLNCDPLRLNQLFFKFFSKIMSDPERLMNN